MEKCRKNSTEIAGRILERDGKCQKDSKEEKEEKRKFRKMLRRIGFIIMVTQKEFRTSINRPTTPLKGETRKTDRKLDFRYELQISHPSNPEP